MDGLPVKRHDESWEEFFRRQYDFADEGRIDKLTSFDASTNIASLCPPRAERWRLKRPVERLLIIFEELDRQRITRGPFDAAITEYGDHEEITWVMRPDHSLHVRCTHIRPSTTAAPLPTEIYYNQIDLDPDQTRRWRTFLQRCVPAA